LNKIITGLTGVKRLFLHAGKLEFFHPVFKSSVVLESPTPEEFKTVLDFWKTDSIK
jgi:tRNA pseudouridine65 synthase